MKFRLLLCGGVVMAALAFLLLPTFVAAAIVTCEPSYMTPHPTTYFYDVDPQNNFT